MSLSTPACAQVLWGGVSVGQPLAQVQRTWPAATVPLRPETLSAGELEGLRLPLAGFAGRSAEARFFSREGRVTSVQLRTLSLPPGNSTGNLAYARSVADALARQLGPPQRCDPSDVAAIHQLECRWTRDGVAVRELYLDVASQAPVFLVSYRRADDPDSDL